MIAARVHIGDCDCTQSLHSLILTVAGSAVFVYDNGCNHAHYCLNREPMFFRDTQQLIDAMHYRGHTNCPTSFNIASVSKERRKPLLNSQLAEQQNAKLAYIVTQASHPSSANWLTLFCLSAVPYHRGTC